MNYTPFEVPFENISEQDLQILIDKQISEGWYIEYKSEIPKKSGSLDSNKLAKSISSFANTEGGWYFIGMTCNNSNLPISITGIDITQYKNITDQISQILTSNINPKPYYELKLIVLANDKVVIVIRIHKGVTPPYITSQGIIFQRENSESNPIKDRYIIEKLNDRSKNYYKSINNFCSINYGETKGQFENPQTSLELYLFPLPFDEYRFDGFYKSDFFNNTASRFYDGVLSTFDTGNEKITIPLNLGFNSIYNSHRSLVIRPINENNIIYKTTTVELFDNGSLKFYIPLSSFDINNVPLYYKDSEAIEYILNKFSPLEEIEEYLNIPPFGRKIPALENDYVFKTKRRRETGFVNHIKIIDGVELIFTIFIVISIYRGVLSDNKYDFSKTIGFRARITNMWRKFIFLPGDIYLEGIKKYNLPITPKDFIEIPSFKNGNYYPLDLSDQYEFITISQMVLEGIGLPNSQLILDNLFSIIIKGLERFTINK